MATPDTDYESSSTVGVRGEATPEQSTTVTTTTTTDKPAYDVFISYQCNNKENARHIYEGLTKKGLHCWMDEKNMPGGTILPEEIQHGLKNCRVLLSCVTQNYLDSKYCCREVAYADCCGKPIIPVLLQEMKWPLNGELGFTFSRTVYIDFSSCLEELISFQGAGVDALWKALSRYLPDIDNSPKESDSSITDNSPKEIVSSTTDASPSMLVKDMDSHSSIQSDSDVVESSGSVEDSTQTNSTLTTDRGTEICGTDIIKLHVFFLSNEFTPNRSNPAINQIGEGRWYGSQSTPFIRFQGVGVPGWWSFTEIRATLKPLFENGERITKIEQRRGNVRGKDVVEVTSIGDELPEEKKREVCDIYGKSTSLSSARPSSVISRLGGEILISGGQRRTILYIRNT